MQILTWIAIAFCISQSAMFSGLNLAFFSVSRLSLEVEALTGNESAKKVLALRKDSNYLLTTVLWGNVGVNVLLTLLSGSILTGLWAFFFSTFVITIFGEIMPQAYFSRNALRMASLLMPIFKTYQILLYPIIKPSAKLLDLWLGQENIQYFRERGLREIIKKHVEASDVDIDRLEGLGALNFLDIDDLLVSQEGEPVDPKSIIKLPLSKGLPVFPEFERSPSDPFLQQIQSSGKKWVIITDESEEPHLVLDSDEFLRSALFNKKTDPPYAYCHRPIIVKDPHIELGNVILKLRVRPETAEDDVIDHDVILVWSNEKRVITGADILGRLLRGIVINLRK
jgi:metal transporter CNNM